MVARWQLGGKIPTLLVGAASVAAVLLTAAILFETRWTPSRDAQTWVSAGVRVVMSAMSEKGGIPLATVPNPGDRLLGGLLSPDFDDSSCLSRYRASLYRQASLHALSPHLVSGLRRYESLHRLCAPGTPAYARAVERLRAASPNASAGDGADPSGARCNYLVWTPNAGLGNRILSIASGFLYALLTDRVLLLHSGSRHDLDGLFCEPFPGSTWILPEKDLPGHEGLGIRTNESLGNTLRRGEALGGAPWLYVHLLHNYYAQDKLFFCDDVQAELARVPWLVFQADNYFVPALFLIQRHERELARMFPRRDAVFHHLGRYLFHPRNTVWGMVTRYHGSSYFAQADERVGIQVRVFKWAPISTDELYGQILSCAQHENILPGVSVPTRANTTAVGSGTQAPAKRKAVVVVSLYNEYSEKLGELYHEHGGVAGGEVVSVFQPTHLGEQRFGDRQQDQKALAEMVLLSFADVLVTTGVSTFGYVSQGLAGLRPWVLMPPNHGKAPDTPCRLAPTIEPCFHSPPNYDCRAKASGDTGRKVRHIRHCEDFPQGVQLLQS
ncbi:probable fucosyltransferase 7 [Miscanthus floridulus]|uniref:probable fucosyltransferase 7 n=1 Tax=Miscanthus floridulus TaxID=154761 RepID=UPI0034578A34